MHFRLEFKPVPADGHLAVISANLTGLYLNRNVFMASVRARKKKQMHKNKSGGTGIVMESNEGRESKQV